MTAETGFWLYVALVFIGSPVILNLAAAYYRRQDERHLNREARELMTRAQEEARRRAGKERNE